MSGTTPLPMPLEPTPPVHIISPAAPAQPAHQLQEPVSPPPALASPQVTSQPAQVEGVVSERQHQPPPQPAIEPSAPPSVNTTQTLLPHDQLPGGMTPPNPVSPQYCQFTGAHRSLDALSTRRAASKRRPAARSKDWRFARAGSYTFIALFCLPAVNPLKGGTHEKQ